MKYSIVVYLDSDYKRNAVITYSTNKSMESSEDEGRIKLKKILDEKYPNWYSCDIFKFENQEVKKN